MSGTKDWLSHLRPAHLDCARGTCSLGTAAIRLAPVSREARADQGRSAAPLAWPKWEPTGGGRVQRRTSSVRSTPLCGGACAPTGAAANPDLYRCPTEGS